jgi:hypothetical protein
MDLELALSVASLLIGGALSRGGTPNQRLTMGPIGLSKSNVYRPRKKYANSICPWLLHLRLEVFVIGDQRKAKGNGSEFIQPKNETENQCK